MTRATQPDQPDAGDHAGIDPAADPKPKTKAERKPAAAAPVTPPKQPAPAYEQAPAPEPASAPETAPRQAAPAPCSIPEFDLAAATAAAAAFCSGLGDPDDRVALLARVAGAGTSSQITCPRSDVVGRVGAQLAAHPAADMWISVNRLHPGATRRRRCDIAAVNHVVLDVDLKPGGCDDDATALAIIADVTAAVAAVPVRLVRSGHGWQAWWAVTDGLIGGAALPDHDAAEVFSDLFQLLASHIAAPRGVKLDDVSDLPRTMRIPGTWNVKAPESPAQAQGWQAEPDDAGGWRISALATAPAAALSVAEVRAAADRAGIAPPTPRERVEADARSQELTDEVDSVPWDLWLDGDPRLTATGEIDGCGCPIWHWAGADNSKSATLHEGCSQGYGVHVWSGSMIGQLELDGDHLSRLDLSVALTGVTPSEAAARVGITLGGGREPLAGVFPEHFEQYACTAEAAGQARRAAQFREAAAVMRARQGGVPVNSSETYFNANTKVIGSIQAPPAIGAAGGAAAVVDGLPAVDPQLPRYVARAEAELAAASFDVDWNVPPSSLIPRDLRPLREAVTGPRASDRPVVVPARDAAVAQAIAKAVGGSKLLRDVARSTRAAQANLSWDGARWINDADAAAVCVDALVSTHIFDINPVVRQNKLIVLGFRKPTQEEETMQREDALKAATARGEAFDLEEFVPEQVPFHDQKWCDSATRADALARIVGRQPEVAVTDTAAFDADPRLLAAEGGYIRLGKAAEHAVMVTAPDPAALATKMLGARYDATATCPQWDRFLVQVLPDEELRAFLQRAVGVALLGAVRAQILLALTGDGANGKGVVTNVLLKMLGDYGVALDSRVLTAKSEGDHPAQLMPLRGARVAVIDELPEGLMWAENLIKRLTGGSKVTARWMNENPQSWDPTHTIILTTNGHPLVPPGAKAFWRRYREIPFTQSFATTADEFATGAYAGMADDALEGRLITELPGILIWALEGYRQYLVRGLDEPAAVIAAGRAARADSSSFAAFCSRMFIATGVEADVVRVQQAWHAWTHYRISGDGHYQRPTNPRDLPTMLVKELGRRTRYIHSTGGKTPARLVGVKWSAEGEALLAECEGPRGAFSPPRLGVVHPPAATA